MDNTPPTLPETEEERVKREKFEQSQISLFGFEEPWKDEWKGMPDFVQNDLEPFKTLIVHFESRENVEKFAAVIGQTITMSTRSLWYPEADYLVARNKFYVQEPKDESNET